MLTWMRSEVGGLRICIASSPKSKVHEGNSLRAVKQVLGSTLIHKSWDYRQEYFLSLRIQISLLSASRKLSVSYRRCFVAIRRIVHTLRCQVLYKVTQQAFPPYAGIPFLSLETPASRKFRWKALLRYLSRWQRSVAFKPLLQERLSETSDLYFRGRVLRRPSPKAATERPALCERYTRSRLEFSYRGARTARSTGQ